MPSAPPIRKETHLPEFRGFKVGDQVKWNAASYKANYPNRPMFVSDIIEIWPGRVWVGVKTLSDVLPDGRKIFTTTGGDDTINEIEKA